MTISIIGAGNVGSALAAAFSKKGQSVVVGVQDLSKYAAAIGALGPLVELTDVATAILRSSLLILATPYNVTTTVVSSVADWDNKIIVDATNPLAPDLTGLTVGTQSSGAETVASHANNARVVKAFNTTGAENMANSQYPNGHIFMPVCGNDAQAKSEVIALATLIGFEAVDLGELSVARYLEPFGMTWIHLAIKQGYGRNFAFSLLHR